MNAKEYGFREKEIAEKLWNIQGLEWKEKELKDKCKKFSKKLSKYEDVLPLTENIAAAGINMNELLGLRIVIDQAVKYHNLPFVRTTLYLIEDIKKYNKINGLNKELSTLYLQKLAINEACSRQVESLVALANLKSHGITEDRILELNNFLENNRCKDVSYTSNTSLPEFRKPYPYLQRHINSGTSRWCWFPPPPEEFVEAYCCTV